MNPPIPPLSDSIIEVTSLSRRFGVTLALNEVSLGVPRGVVFGLVGENGAGKTTLIKHLLGLFKPQTGSVRVFGLDPVSDPPGVLSRTGYLSEDRDLPPWMRVEELMRYTAAFYPKWDADYAEALRTQFGLRSEAKIKSLSRGEAARAGLLAALGHRPDLLVLDEPSSGLDPVVRRDILEAIIRTVAEEGRTVFFSSHLLDEVERVADFVAMMAGGRIALCGPLDEIKAGHRQLVLRFADRQNRPPSLAGTIHMSGGGHEWIALCNGNRNELISAAAQMGARVIEERTPSLEEIFVARVASPASAPATAIP
jgi:ABC-2 type transport system ATP-binding protein